MKTLNKFNRGPEKIDVWFDHFQMEFDLHIWWLSSPHEYFEMVEYEGGSSLASGRTRHRFFWSAVEFLQCFHYMIGFVEAYTGR